MARIRTIKPEFFTSEDIVELPPLARLLYIALWCEADRDGRMVWKPNTFKLRYLPGDDCDIYELCDELTTRGLLVIYTSDHVEYAYIPTFHAHQHINPRESASQLPEPREIKRVLGSRTPRVNHASTTREPRDPDAQVGREGKGKERKGKEEGSAEGSLRFKKPTIPELQTYFSEIGLGESPQRFLDYYEQKGWKVSGSQMKDWRAAARLWKSRRDDDSAKSPQPKKLRNVADMTQEELEMIQR